MKKTNLCALLLCLSLVFLCYAGCFGNTTPPAEFDPGYNDNVKPNGPGTEGENNVKKHVVTLDYNDGSGRTEKITVPAGASVSDYAVYPFENGREVYAWSASQSGEEYSAPVAADMTLYAQWEEIAITVYTDNIPDTVNDKYVEIRPGDNENALSGKVLRIGPNVKSLSLISEGTVYNRFAVIINNRVQDLALTMDNFSFISDQDFGIKDAEMAETRYLVKLRVLGHISINCAVYSAAGVERAADCIRVTRLSLYGEGVLDLFAGHGKNGTDRPRAEDGQNGQDGSNGMNGGYGIIADALEVTDIRLTIIAGNGGRGGNGGEGNVGGGLATKGGNGGNGGKGGIGGDAICTKSFTASFANLSLQGGNGGAGGNGGKGGGGGVGWVGTFKMAGDGGNGGKGGCVFSTGVAQYQTGSLVRSYTVGRGGAGGKAGQGASGSVGYDGSAGRNATDGLVNVRE